MVMSVWHLLLVLCGLLSCCPGIARSGGIVTLESIKIYDSHEWIKSVKPIVYFSCKGENNTELPDVKQLNVSYTFKGQESWQPLTEFMSNKCKRCGFYEKDTFKADDVFDEWEFCPSGFDADAKYDRTKAGQFDATFFCPQCVPPASGSGSSSVSHKRTGMPVAALAILIVALVSTAFILGLLALYRYWQKKKREQEQARFLKLFEDGDDIEDELGLGNVV